jgi:CubicO group peptidase (beta-lactamase class C family)
MFHFFGLPRRIVITLVGVCLCAVAASAADTEQKDRQPGKVTDPADLEAFFDGAFNVQMEAKHIAGAVVAVVAGDKPVFSKGYGYADIEARRKVDPEKTMFRVGSISKLFTWTAVMQQNEEGKLDLDTDVNQYLKDVKIPATFEQPITMRHLMTHTPGFEDYVLGLFAHKADELRPLEEVLRTQMPVRVLPPGVIASYSNHGTGIAGDVVERVTGQSWADYVEQRILEPLGMKHTLVRQPVPEKLPADLSKGYKWEGGRFVAKDFEYIPLAPAGCISMTAADAAKFMLAHLHDGQLGDGRILKPETAKRMREPLFRNDPKTSAMCYGFMEQIQNGQRMVGHGGDTFWFHSLMQLIPEQKVGLFVSYNTDTGGRQGGILFDAFLKRYFPQPDPPRIEPADGVHERTQRVAGEYTFTRYSHSSLAKLAALAGVFKVARNADDTLTVSMFDSARRYAEVEPFVFRELDGPQKVVFQEDKNGKIAYLFSGDIPVGSAVRREWYELQFVQLGLAGASLVVFISAVLLWPAIAFSIRGMQSPRIKRNGFSGVLSVLAWLFSAVSIGFAVALGIALREPNEIAYGLTPAVKSILAVTQICAVLAVLTVLGCLFAWKNRYWRLTGRVHYTLVALVGIGFIWFLYYWNLLTFGFEGIL